MAAVTPRPVRRFFAIFALALAALAFAFWQVQRDFAHRSRIAELTTQRDLARLELRSLHNEIAAERLLAAHARSSGLATRQFAFLDPTTATATAARALVLWDQPGSPALFVAESLPPLDAGDRYVLVVRDEAAAHDCIVLPAADVHPSIRATFKWPLPSAVSARQFTLARRPVSGPDVPVLAGNAR